jgi:mannose-6-phosphate isomerase
MDLLEPVVQPYAWGSASVLAELLGRPVPSPGPEAELWVSAHPAGPGVLRRDSERTTLDAVIAADPTAELGADTVARFGPRLPFLLKILAAERSLSIQVHPDAHQARAGFEAENSRGMPLTAPTRTYVDPYAKPEVLCALTPFEALAGFRPAGEAAEVIDALGLPELTPLVAGLRERGNLIEALAAMLAWPPADRVGLLDRVVGACTRLPAPLRAAGEVAVKVAGDHPGDLGALASLLLRRLVLQPGEALFMPAGGIHAYVRGVGVEILGNSDNVVRAGLTGKHVDVPELLRLVDPTVEVPLLQPRPLDQGVVLYDAGVPEFRLYRVELGGEPTRLPGAGPRLVLCLEGEAALIDDCGTALKLGRGTACFVPATDGCVTATGLAVLYAAGTG